MYAHILVEFDITKGLQKMISLDSPLVSWNIPLDYEGIPFRCRKCHLTGHLAATCSSSKTRHKLSNFWWKGVSAEHF